MFYIFIFAASFAASDKNLFIKRNNFTLVGKSFYLQYIKTWFILVVMALTALEETEGIHIASRFRKKAAEEIIFSSN